MSIPSLKPTNEKIYSQARSDNALSIGRLGTREVKLVAFDKKTGEFVNLNKIGLEAEQLEKIQNLWNIYSEAYDLETHIHSRPIDYIEEKGPFSNESSYSSSEDITLEDSLQERFKTVIHSNEISIEKKKAIHIWRAITEEISATFVKKRIPLETIEVTDDLEYLLIPTDPVSEDDDDVWDWSPAALGVSALLGIMLGYCYSSGTELISSEQIIDGINYIAPSLLETL